MTPARPKYLLFCLTILIIFLFVGELAARLAGYKPHGHSTVSVTGYFWVADAVLGFKNRSNGHYVNSSVEGSPVVNTDQYGYRRTYSCALSTAAPTVAFVGDSTTFCAEVNDNQTGPSEVCRLLCSRGHHISIINAGVRGYNTVQSMRMVKELISQYPSVRLFVYVYCDNDFVENVNPIVYYPARAPTAFLQADTAKIIEKAPQTEIVPWGQSFEGTTPPSKGVASAILEFSHSALLQFGATTTGFIVARFRRPSFTVLDGGSMGPTGGGTAEWRQQESWAAQRGGEKILEGLIRDAGVMCRTSGAELMVTRFASEPDEKADGRLAAICRRAQVRFVPISAAFGGDRKQFISRLEGTPLYDGHYGPRGTRRFAEAVGSAIESDVFVEKR